jgi:hypothetical protein
MRNVLVSAVLGLAACVPAAAQSASAPLYLSINGGVQSSSSSLSDHFEFDQYQEKATVDVSYPKLSGQMFDAGVGVNLWKGLGIGFAATRVTATGTASVEASIPHPFLFKTPRTISGEVQNTRRSETTLHFQALYTISAGRLRVVLSGGPSRFSVEQDLVTEVQYDESYPYDTATFRSGTKVRSRATKGGVHGGADIILMLSGHFGVGGMVRVTRTTIPLTAGDRTVDVDAGGVQAGGGIRMVF